MHELLSWYKGLPTWAKIAIPLVGIGVVVLIWQPWNSQSSQATEKGAGSSGSGGSGTSGSSGGVATGEPTVGVIPASYSTPPEAPPTYSITNDYLSSSPTSSGGTSSGTTSSGTTSASAAGAIDYSTPASGNSPGVTVTNLSGGTPGKSGDVVLEV